MARKKTGLPDYGVEVDPDLASGKALFDKLNLSNDRPCSFCHKTHSGICVERKMVMDKTNKVTGDKTDRPACVCTKPAKFFSKRLDKSFCSDKCYEDFQRGNDPSKPHIVVTRKNGAFFEQGDVKFSIDEHNLDLNLGSGRYSNEPSVIEKLMDSQVAALAQANGIPIVPFVRHLVTRPLHGIIQFVWYRDLKHNVDFNHLAHNQEQRIKDYMRLLLEYKPSEDGTGERPAKARKTNQKSNMLALSYKAVAKHVKVNKGRAADLLEVIRSFKDGVAFPQIVEAAKDKVKTKQPLEKIVQRFIKELQAEGAIEEVKS
jgi:hypothetical protein